jgi:hypothetical protein
VALASPDCRGLAAFLIGRDHVVGVDVQDLPEGERVIVRTDHAMEFYRSLPGWVLENELTVDEILTLDDSLEAVFQYLTER